MVVLYLCSDVVEEGQLWLVDECQVDCEQIEVEYPLYFNQTLLHTPHPI